MPSTSNTNNSANTTAQLSSTATPLSTSTSPAAAAATALPAAALVPYESVWGQIDEYIKTKSRSEALVLSCGEAEALADFEKSYHSVFGTLIGEAIRSFKETDMYEYMSEDLRNCYIEESVWRKIGE